MRVAVTRPEHKWAMDTTCDMLLEVTTTNVSLQSVVQTRTEIVMVGKGPHPTCYVQCKVAGVEKQGREGWKKLNNNLYRESSQDTVACAQSGNNLAFNIIDLIRAQQDIKYKLSTNKDLSIGFIKTNCIDK